MPAARRLCAAPRRRATGWGPPTAPPGPPVWYTGSTTTACRRYPPACRTAVAAGRARDASLPAGLQHPPDLRRAEMERVVGDVAHRRHPLVGDLEAGHQVGDRLVVELRRLGLPGRRQAGRRSPASARRWPSMRAVSRALATLSAVASTVTVAENGSSSAAPARRPATPAAAAGEPRRTPPLAPHDRRPQRQGHCKPPPIPYLRGSPTAIMPVIPQFCARTPSTAGAAAASAASEAHGAAQGRRPDLRAAARTCRR